MNLNICAAIYIWHIQCYMDKYSTHGIYIELQYDGM